MVFAKRIWNIGTPIVIAHRGGGTEAPENSLQAFELMRQRGFFYLETDAQITKDGVVVLFHDEILDRTTNGTGKVSAHTWEEVARLSDGSGVHPLKLSTVLSDYPEFVLNIDAKTDEVVVPLAQELQANQALNRVCLASFSEKRLVRLRKLLPGVATSLGQSSIVRLVIASRLPKNLAEIVLRNVPRVADGVQAVQVPVSQWGIPVVTKRFIDLAHNLGFAVHVWTVNEESQMRKLLAMGVDALITDVPSLARKVIDTQF